MPGSSKRADAADEMPASQCVHPASEDKFVTIARVTKTQGRYGEVAAALFTDFPERFASRRHLLVTDKDGRRHAVEVEQYWFHKGQVVLKFKGVDSISDAEALVGTEIQIPLSERTLLEAGTLYVSDLVGCSVYDHGLRVGVVQDVQFGAGEAPLLLVRDAKEYLIPFAGEYIESVSLADKRLKMRLPEGMLQLDAPLTAEEKERQKRRE
jgi:16S rRNA processing protein RimM